MTVDPSTETSMIWWVSHACYIQQTSTHLSVSGKTGLMCSVALLWSVSKHQKKERGAPFIFYYKEFIKLFVFFTKYPCVMWKTWCTTLMFYNHLWYSSALWSFLLFWFIVVFFWSMFPVTAVTGDFVILVLCLFLSSPLFTSIIWGIWGTWPSSLVLCFIPSETYFVFCFSTYLSQVLAQMKAPYCWVCVTLD